MKLLLTVFLFASSLSVAQDFATTVTTTLFIVPKDGVVQDLKPEELSIHTKSGLTGNIRALEFIGAKPLHLVLMVDDSGSTRYSQSKETALENIGNYLPSLISGSDRAMVISFNDKPYLICEFTQDAKEIKKALAVQFAKGGTLFLDSLASVLVEKLSGLPSKDRVLILVITDGNDNASKSKQADVVKAAVALRVPIFAIDLSQYQYDDGKGRKMLKALTQATGGAVFNLVADSPNKREFKRLSDAFNSQYLVTVDLPPKSPAEEWQITINRSKTQVWFPAAALR
jgi:VWFA-related protein